MIEEIVALVAVVFWWLGPFLSVSLLLLIGGGFGAFVDSIFANRIEKDLRRKLQERENYSEYLEGKLELAQFHKRDSHGRFTR